MNNTIFEAVESFKYLSGVGNKSATRYVNDILAMDEFQQEIFFRALNDLKNIRRCSICYNYAYEDTCELCSEQRDTNILVLVSTPNEVQLIDELFEKKYLFHILGGVLDPLKGINVEDLSLDLLDKRIDNFTELIVALPATTQGEITANYILEKYKNKLKITKIAQGMPSGGSLDNLDELTLYKAISMRQEYKE